MSTSAGDGDGPERSTKKLKTDAGNEAQGGGGSAAATPQTLHSMDQITILDLMVVYYNDHSVVPGADDSDIFYEFLLQKGISHISPEELRHEIPFLLESAGIRNDTPADSGNINADVQNHNLQDDEVVVHDHGVVDINEQDHNNINHDDGGADHPVIDEAGHDQKIGLEGLADLLLGDIGADAAGDHGHDELQESEKNGGDEEVDRPWWYCQRLITEFNLRTRCMLAGYNFFFFLILIVYSLYRIS